jgi:hypothetical protein
MMNTDETTPTLQSTTPAFGWEEIKAAVASRFPLVAEGDGWFGFRWVMNSGKALRFKVAKTALSGEARVLVMSPAAAERDILPRRALEEAAAIGPSVVIEEGLYVVRHWLELDGLERADLDRALTLVADGVLRLQAQVQPRAATPSLSAGRPFANFAD